MLSGRSNRWFIQTLINLSLSVRNAFTMVPIVYARLLVYIVLRIVLDDLLICRPIIIRPALHELIRWFSDVLFLGLLKLSFLLLW